jgi:DNA-directed RNA polymerase subunit RPC12/RpoP
MSADLDDLERLVAAYRRKGGERPLRCPECHLGIPELAAGRYACPTCHAVFETLAALETFVMTDKELHSIRCLLNGDFL